MSKIPQALTIAGSDSGGGAGIQADLKTFQEREVFGTSVITAVTAQSTQGVFGIQEITCAMIQQQLQVIFADFNITGIKTGMLSTSQVIHVVAKELVKYPEIPLVIDPVMIAKGGETLLQREAIDALKKQLIPLATVITPNIPEAEVITGEKILTLADYPSAAKAIQQLGANNVVIKGGHEETSEFASDYVLYENGDEEWLTTPRMVTKNTHGTGCTFSACITGELAKGKSVAQGIALSKKFIQAAITDSIEVGHGHGPTNHWAYRKRANHEK